MSEKMKRDGCQCEDQIVFYFDGKQVILVCERCERTLHYGHKVCPTCGDEITHFVREEE